MTPRRILFVDDERAVLDSLRNSLRRKRHVWDMAFAQDGAAALAEIERAPVDVVVSDMKMSGMDGAALLAAVKARQPRAARIILSGHAEHEAVLRSLAVAHQFLAKPCDTDVLSGVVERTCNLQALLANEAIQAVIGGLDTLPAGQQSYLALTSALRRPRSGLAEIAAIVEEDPAMAAKILQLVNSAYFGLRHSVTSVLEAVRYLGVELLVGLVLTSRLFTRFDGRDVGGFPAETLQRRSLLCARASRLVLANHPAQEEAFTAALLHDVGQMILAVAAPGRHAEVRREAERRARPLHEVEREAFGVSHAEVGAYLLGVWGLPFGIVEAVAFHHDPAKVTADARDALAVLHLVDALVDAPGVDREAPIPGADMDFLASGPWAAELRRWRAVLAAEFGGAAEAGASVGSTAPEEVGA